MPGTVFNKFTSVCDWSDSAHRNDCTRRKTLEVPDEEGEEEKANVAAMAIKQTDERVFVKELLNKKSNTDEEKLS